VLLCCRTQVNKAVKGEVHSLDLAEASEAAEAGEAAPAGPAGVAAKTTARAGKDAGRAVGAQEAGVGTAHV
jgi:hypothetical protein